MAQIGIKTYTITIKDSLTSNSSITVLEQGRWYDNNNENGDEEERIKQMYNNALPDKVIIIESE